VISGAGVLSATNILEQRSQPIIQFIRAMYHGCNFRLTTNDPDGSGPCSPVYKDINITINRAAKVLPC